MVVRQTGHDSTMHVGADRSLSFWAARPRRLTASEGDGEGNDAMETESTRHLHGRAFLPAAAMCRPYRILASSYDVAALFRALDAEALGIAIFNCVVRPLLRGRTRRC